jgi:hypothetical protein
VPLENIFLSIDWNLLLSIGIPAIVAIVGWFFVHKLNSTRELATRKREARLKAVETAYMRIATTMNRPLNEKSMEALETFVAEIQLYGTPRQIELMQIMVEEFKKPYFVVSYDALLEDLRDTIRNELNMEEVKGPIWWLRFNNSKEKAITNQAVQEGQPKLSDSEHHEEEADH